jgi:hypothetical protein
MHAASSAAILAVSRRSRRSSFRSSTRRCEPRRSSIRLTLAADSALDRGRAGRRPSSIQSRSRCGSIGTCSSEPRSSREPREERRFPRSSAPCSPVSLVAGDRVRADRSDRRKLGGSDGDNERSRQGTTPLAVYGDNCDGTDLQNFAYQLAGLFRRNSCLHPHLPVRHERMSCRLCGLPSKEGHL